MDVLVGTLLMMHVGGIGSRRTISVASFALATERPLKRRRRCISHCEISAARPRTKQLITNPPTSEKFAPTHWR
jgi:predicted secreted Zn-dependent protease